MAKLSQTVAAETVFLAKPFRISGFVFDRSEIIVATVGDGDHVGRGEGGGVYYLGDDIGHMLAAIEGARGAIEAGVSRQELRSVMPAGGGRNAVDCALWELDPGIGAVEKGQTSRLRSSPRTAGPFLPPSGWRSSLHSDRATPPYGGAARAA